MTLEPLREANGWDPLTTGPMSCGLVREGLLSPLTLRGGRGGAAAEHSPVTVFLDTIAALLAPLPVARVLAGLRGL